MKVPCERSEVPECLKWMGGRGEGGGGGWNGRPDRAEAMSFATPNPQRQLRPAIHARSGACLHCGYGYPLPCVLATLSLVNENLWTSKGDQRGNVWGIMGHRPRCTTKASVFSAWRKEWLHGSFASRFRGRLSII